METVPGWLALSALMSLALIGILLILPLFDRRNRAMFMMGIRYSLSRRNESIGKILPITLLVAIILSSLSVGDGLFEMVASNTDKNLSGVDVVLEAPGFVPMDILPDDGRWTHAPIIMIDGVSRRVNGPSSGVTVIGFDDRFLDMGELISIDSSDIISIPGPYDIFMNRKAADGIGSAVGDPVLITLDRHSKTDDILLSSGGNERTVLNMTLEIIVKNNGLGRYREDSLDKIEPMIFMSLTRLQERFGVGSNVNRFLIDTDEDTGSIVRSIEEGLEFSDIGITVVDARNAGGTFIRSDEFFFGQERMDPGMTGDPSLSYFVDDISTDEGSIGYSVVSGLETAFPEYGRSLRPGEMIINNWTAKELDLKVGDNVRLGYRTLTGYGVLEEGNREFDIVRIVPISGFYAERELIPPIQGVTSELSCSDWDPSFEVDIDSLEDRDLDYWEMYTTTPKAFISLEEAREIWSTPWGNTTAIHFPQGSPISPDDIEDGLLLSSVDITLIPVRDNALGSSRAVAIFPGMFLTFGMAVIFSSGLVLFAVLGEMTGRRTKDWGTLRSIGVGRGRIFLFGIYENVRSILMGSLLGVFLGYMISFAIGRALEGVWSETVEGSSVPLLISPSSVYVSFASGIILSLFIVVFVVFKAVRKVPAVNSRGEGSEIVPGNGRIFMIAGVGSIILMSILLWALSINGVEGTFGLAGPFVLGSLVYTIGIVWIILSLTGKVYHGSDRSLMVTANLSRRPGQTRTGMIFLACVLALALSLSGIGAILQGNLSNEMENYGGGYDLVMETYSGIEGTSILPEVKGNDIVPILTYGKEGGKCSNINAVYPPRLVGLPDVIMDGFNTKDDDTVRNFQDLGSKEDDRIPIMVDENTLKWIYFGDVGTVFEIEPNPGTVVELVVIAILQPSILAGTFVMSEGFLKEIYPSPSSYDLFLIRGDTSDRNIQLIREHFDELGPEVRKVKDLAKENMEFELSYLGLFRDFLMFGALTSMAALVVFNHSRAVRFKNEMVIHRAIGVTKGRARSYILFENLMVLGLSLIASMIGAVITIAFSWKLFGDDIDILDLSSGILPILFILAFISVVSSMASAYWSVKGYDRQVPRYDA